MAISAASHFGVKCDLVDPHRAAGLLKHRRIGGLILIERMRQRHQNARPADRREFRHRRGARARHDEVAGRDPRRQIGEERLDLGRHRKPGIDFLHARHVLVAHLLRDR